MDERSLEELMRAAASDGGPHRLARIPHPVEVARWRVVPEEELGHRQPYRLLRCSRHDRLVLRLALLATA